MHSGSGGERDVYSNPPLQPVDLGQRLVEVAKKRPAAAQNRPPKQHQRRLRPVELERLRADYLAGTKIADLARSFGISRQTVLAHMRREGLPRRHPKLTPDETARAIDLYLAGDSLARVGAALAV